MLTLSEDSNSFHHPWMPFIWSNLSSASIVGTPKLLWSTINITKIKKALSIALANKKAKTLSKRTELLEKTKPKQIEKTSTYAL